MLGVENIKRAAVQNFKSWIRDTAATVMVAFAVMAPVVVGASGMALDMAQAYLIKERLSNALDSAALAAAGSSADEAVIRQRVLDFFHANFPDEELGVTFDPVVTVNGDEISVYGTAYYNTMFLRLLGVDEIDLASETVVQRQVQGIEVVLVMDNTGSMSSNNNIATLRTAATNFVNILFNATANPNHIRIGLVPYSTSVNVGPYGLGYDHEGSYYDTPFVNNPHDLEYNQSRSNEWHGCVLAADNPEDTVDHEGPWDMYRYCRDDNEYPVCDRYWDSYRRTYVARRNANYVCPDSPLLPLTNDQDLLLERIDSMRADGHTLGNYGLVWGYRVLSPEYPFQEGAPWDSVYWRKAIIMMTDGVNTMHPNYSAYGPTDDHNIGVSDLNNRFAQVCENLKEDDVMIYTVTFAGGVNESTKDYYRECASDESKYHHAPSQNDLIDVFESISRELSNLHIKS